MTTIKEYEKELEEVKELWGKRNEDSDTYFDRVELPLQALKDIIKLIDEYMKDKAEQTDMKCWYELEELKARIEGK